MGECETAIEFAHEHRSFRECIPSCHVGAWVSGAKFGTLCGEMASINLIRSIRDGARLSVDYFLVADTTLYTMSFKLLLGTSRLCLKPSSKYPTPFPSKFGFNTFGT